MAGTFFNKRNTPLNAMGGKKIEFKLVGNWEETIRTISQLSPKIKAASIFAQLKIGEEIKKKVKNHLRNQDLGWAELSPLYAKKKADAGLSGKILMAYKTYYQNIEVWQKSNQHLVFIGVRRGIYTKRVGSNKKSRYDVATIGAIHEFSQGKRIPKRPLWNPTIAEYGGAIGIKIRYAYYLSKHLKFLKVPIKELSRLL